MHSIRLHGPWECEPLASSNSTSHGPDDSGISLPDVCRVTIPSDWSEALGLSFRGRVRFKRRFHSPTGLAEGQRVYLCVERVETSGMVSLNGRSLGAVDAARGPFRFEVTGRLARNNVLEVEVESLDRPGFLGSVRLEIEE
jgi:beta-galactosidase/beta-glucuronidase